jgi:hypothetical protein
MRNFPQLEKVKFEKTFAAKEKNEIGIFHHK